MNITCTTEPIVRPFAVKELRYFTFDGFKEWHGDRYIMLRDKESGANTLPGYGDDGWCFRVKCERFQEDWNDADAWPGTMRVKPTKAGASDCRNRNLQRMFMFVGYSEQAGSGYQKILSGWRGEHWADPFISDDIDDCQTFLTLKLNGIPATEHHIVPWEMDNNANGAVDRATESADSNTTETATEGTTESATETPAASTVERILQVLKTDPSASMKKLAQFCGITEDGIFYHIKQLKRKGRIRRVGPDYGGHWEVVS